MFDTMPDGSYAKVVTDRQEVFEFLNSIYADNVDDVEYGSLPYVSNDGELPVEFPCVLGVFWHEDKYEATVTFAFNLADVSNMSYFLCKAGAKLSGVTDDKE